MSRSSVTIALFCLVALLSRTSTAFTISLAPLLTTRLVQWRSNYANNFSAPAPASTSAGPASASKVKAGAMPKVKPAVQNFKFDYEDIRMLSDCKSECMELIYAKSLDRGFASA
mmetsp:Transcript_38278/g.92340  ORF Transcript_38278/g.92340 Transcript_38278/m.92340 type:complete len:114 (-) Transcript_38278:233-574(-)|eukprot:CAMPEP_0181085180 /NCGR_PEP_ID=MMETSP1071-20121207/5096_1 /TAXON_ID=35127 /ORGANISM="Thalassiosira sp., Strain NH16" /LENGTH=113 /DNA_ID=CAMNT_0023166973 /DNA_START=84 /DNA_END=425 /DNA_ORIENTATION=+